MDEACRILQVFALIFAACFGAARLDAQPAAGGDRSLKGLDLVHILNPRERLLARIPQRSQCA
jgi:hypothetical protein